MTLKVLKDYKGAIEKTLNENSVSSKQCYDIYNKVVDALKSCLVKDDLAYVEKNITSIK